ncbi:MAG: hypothetical protein JWP03_4268 [Phycisphaerales bacterium]|jgi:hypothetical protein|nr:hypothetical protein [Phycisphaerales bacterium]
MQNRRCNTSLATHPAPRLLLTLAALFACRPCLAASPASAVEILMTHETAIEDARRPAEFLRAGPVRLKFADGELRYLRVGDKEIIRRIYFGVRDGTWATAMPRFTQMDVEKADDHFTIHLAASCKMKSVDYQWSGVITGDTDGKITFRAEGTPNADFDSNRIGLCVLYGNASLAGQAFETDGATPKGVFPPLVSPKLVGEKFHALRYATADGLNVACSVEGATFDMEDQRNWGDSSWKAYAPLPYAYPRVAKGDKKVQTVTLTVGGKTDAAPSPQDPVRLRIGKPIPGAKFPKLVGAADFSKSVIFSDINFGREKFAGAKTISWRYTPTIHLPDNDTIMETLPAVADEAHTVNTFAPQAALRVGPINLAEHGHDPREATPFAAAWAAALVKSLARGGIEEAAFDLSPGPANAVLDALKPYAGREMLEVETDPTDSHHVVAYAVKDGDGVAMLVINHTPRAWHAVIESAGPAKAVKVQQLSPATGQEQEAQMTDGKVSIDLAPFEVSRVVLPGIGK